MPLHRTWIAVAALSLGTGWLAAPASAREGFRETSTESY